MNTEKLKEVEDSVRSIVDRQSRLWQAICYKYLHNCGFTLTGVDHVIKEELQKAGSKERGTRNP